MAAIKIDGTPTQTLRTVLLAALAAVAFVLLAVFGLRAIRHGQLLDLPSRLGADISQTANGFTYSQSQHGHTIFTIHAAQVVSYKGDRAELRGVAITLYGPEGSHRQDRITGSDFFYDKKTGVVTAPGSVQIDMASPSDQPSAGVKALPDTIHVQTSGLRFDQRSGEATTTQVIRFALPRAQGSATGGSYNSKTGVLILQADVELETDQGGTPATLHAGHAQLLRDAHIAYLLQARGIYQGGRESADTAILHFRPDGSIAYVDAEDNVHIVAEDGAELYSTTATIDFNPQSQPLTARAGGGVNFASSSPDVDMHGNAVDGVLVFGPGADGKSQILRSQFHNAVSFVLQQRSFAGDVRGSATREMTASHLDVDFAPGPNGESLARKAVAQGGATVTFHDIPFNAPQKNTTVHAERLVASLKDGIQLQQVDGTGGAQVIDYAPNGATDTTTSDSLHVVFLPVGQSHEAAIRSPHTAAPGRKLRQSASVDTAMQQGHVTLVSLPARGAKSSDGAPEQPQYAEALRSDYSAATNTVLLTGDAAHPPRVHNDTLALTANQISYLRNSGDAVAEGDVRSTYLQKPAPKDAPEGAATPAAQASPPGLGGAGAVHVVAPGAQMTRSAGTIVFTGSIEQPARMWQGANAVTAPVLELSRQQVALYAHGLEGKPTAPAVHTAFFNASPGTGSLTHVTADTLRYSDRTRIGDFHGQVFAQQPGGTVRADDAKIFLSHTETGKPAQLERILASGDVLLSQPGRKGTGAQLLYTASTGNYLLTGAPGAPPRVTDAQRGSTTGAALLFRGGDQSVEVQSSDAAGDATRTVTDTRSPH